MHVVGQSSWLAITTVKRRELLIGKHLAIYAIGPFGGGREKIDVIGSEFPTKGKSPYLRRCWEIFYFAASMSASISAVGRSAFIPQSNTANAGHPAFGHPL